ncbi:hypothetical protein FRC04_008262 [Tulasnella sp. 424]|nr:hypothetical protein FRC04_008262 [Tulasnella sp. 424]
MMLRTHTSAHEVQVFRDQVEKWLLIADVYRRDEIDSSHYPVFHQVEGARTFDLTTSEKIKQLEAENGAMEAKLTSSNIIIEDETVVGVDNPYQIEHDPYQASLVLANLKHHLNSLILNLFSTPAGGDKSEPLRVRWIPAYFPWTGPSYEVEVLFQGKWLEILGCGVVQNHTLVRSDVNDRLAWAFGLGLERIAMVLYNIPDIRLFWSTDPRFLSQFTDGRVTTFKPYSKFPPCYKDISLWVDVPSSDEASKPTRPFHENDFCDIVRDTVGDLVEDVKMIDEFIHPKTALCDPPNQLCHGGWYSYNFSAVDKRTMTFGPSVETRFVLPSATFEFNGTAIYYYGITSAKAASVSISIDGGTASLVNLTQMYNLNASSGIYFPVYAWSATNLDPNKEHKFYLEYAQSNPSGAGLWSGFDSLVFTPSTPTM